MKLSELKKSSPEELLELAQSLGAENISRAKKQTLIFIILKAKAANNEEVIGDGTLDILQDGYGFLRSSDDSYTSGADDIYISPNQIKRFNLSTGDLVAGKI
ncbi:MAG TPA: transcription termination factor Rho, partial [Candidatus Thioglobus sp.]|nr:transcription termination factor Rho [Candidatus Thioglobus sp.]